MNMYWIKIKLPSVVFNVIKAYFSKTAVSKSVQRLFVLSCLFLLSAPAVFAAEDNPAEDGILLEKVYITGGKNDILRKPGSATLIDDIALENFEYTDIHRVLNAVPGVNLQEEDGYGLRPNIGLRGTSPERSKKITVMEDGILSGPAPYSAPAAYYFPNISRMSAIEVFKGPSTIQYGPATVGGAINMVSRPIPFMSRGELDIQYGSDNFQRYNIYQGQQLGDFGYLIEGLRVSADGFKDLDGDSNDTGFVRNDINLKTSWQILGDVSHLFQLKLGYADEDSNETYLGLTRDDFNSDPYRRYVASKLDNTEWNHHQFQLTHQLELANWTLTSDLYRNEFDRDWFKINGFKSSSVSLSDVLADPTSDINAPYYQILKGEAGSGSVDEQLRIGNNGRSFISQGIQARFNSDFDVMGLNNDLEIGLRYHQDEIKRDHTEQDYIMQADGGLLAVTGSFKTTTRNKAEARALAIYLQDEIQIRDTTITLGLRHEQIDSTKTTYGNLTDITLQKDQLSQSVTLPGMGVYSQLNEKLGVLAGIYKGFTAATPGGSGSIEPEESINYELGFRYSGFGQAEVIGFLNDYSQFSGTCSFAQGSCDTNQTGEQANAGSASVYGVEASWRHESNMGAYKIPVSLTYTYSRGEFGEQFVDATGAFGEKGQTIEKGFLIGYLPGHRLNIQTGLSKDKWAVNLSGLYQSAMRNIPGKGSIPVTERIDAHTVFDLTTNYQLLSNLQLYMSLDNLLDEQYIASVKPYGFRPGKPRSINLGGKYQF